MSEWLKEYKSAAQKTQEFYDGVAKYYDEFVPPSTRENRIAIIDEFIQQRLAKNDQPYHILELGCGTGSYSFLLADLGYSVTGMDISPGMKKLAISKVHGHLPENFTYITADWLSGMENDQSEYDCILCIGNSLMHNPKGSIPALIDAIHKALKPGGILILSSRRIEQELNMKKDKNNHNDYKDPRKAIGPVEIPSMGKRDVLRIMFRTIVKKSPQKFVMTFYTYDDFREDSRRFVCHRLLLCLDDKLHPIPIDHETIDTRTYFIYEEDIDKELDRYGFVEIRNSFEGSEEFEGNKNWYKCCRKPI